MEPIRTLRFAWRSLSKRPGTSLLAVLALGFGIGLAAVMFSMIYGVVLRGLPFEDADRLLYVESSRRSDAAGLEVTQHDFVAFSARQSSFEGLAAFEVRSVNLSDDTGYPERYRAGVMTANAFDLLRVEPFLGRDLAPEDAEPGAAAVAVLGYDLWRTRFGGDRGVIGRSVRLNGQPATVVGVMPPGFRFPVDEDLWTAIQIDLARLRRGEGQTLEVYGRLRDGVSLEQARADLGTIAARLEETYPDSNLGRGVVVKPYPQQFLARETVLSLQVMLAAAGLVLLIACANVASLLLVRASTRTRDLAIRAALGARRWRLASQTLGEGLVLASLGAVLGLGIAYGATALLARSFAWMALPFWVRVAVDPHVVAFVVVTALASAVLSGLAPALRSSRVGVGEALKDESRAASSLRLRETSRLLVAGEVALACALLVATGLMVRTVRNLAAGHMAFATEGIFTARLRLSGEDYPQMSDRVRFFDRLVEELKTLPEVGAVALMSAPPGTGMGRTWYAVFGESYATRTGLPRTFRGTVTPEFFAAFDIPVLRGRLFDDRDVEGAEPVVVVDQSFAAKTWPGEDPLGRRLRLGRDEDEPWRTVIGVVPDAGVGELQSLPSGGVYVPHAQMGEHTMTLAIRTRATPSTLASLVREKVGALDRSLAIYSLRTMEQVVEDTTSTSRFVASLFLIFGVAALVLASAGIYGVTAFSVTRRTREIGVRMALGARRREVLALVLRQGLGRVALGLAAGLGLAALLSSSLRVLLFQVEPGDPLSFVTTTLVLGGVAFVACLVPAYHASRVEPIEALRYE